MDFSPISCLLRGIRAKSFHVQIPHVMLSMLQLAVWVCKGCQSGFESYIGWRTDWWSPYIDLGNPLLKSQFFGLSQAQVPYLAWYQCQVFPYLAPHVTLSMLHAGGVRVGQSSILVEELTGGLLIWIWEIFPSRASFEIVLGPRAIFYTCLSVCVLSRQTFLKDNIIAM